MTGTAGDAARGEAEARRRAGLVERAVFDTAAFPEAERLVQFQHIVGAPSLIQPRAAPFHARVLTYWLGPVRMRLFETAPYRVERLRAKIDSDRLDHVMIVHLIQGRARGDFAGLPVEAPEGSVYGFDFARPCRIEADDDPMRYLMIGLPRPLAARWFGDPAALHGALLDGAGPAAAAMMDLVRRLDTLPAAEAQGAFDGLMGRLAPLFSRAARPAAPSASDGALRDRARAVIETHLPARHLTPGFVARQVGVSRSRLYEAFARHGGVAQHIQASRLARVHAALLSPAERRKLADLAHDHGFASPAHMTRLFRDAYGVPPRSLRARPRRRPPAAPSGTPREGVPSEA
ncbi:helix-turn-helix domain-containing protein [Methylobacterium oryzihabitans]|uniref:Helix-turn-helix domain-containing protein n=1 Tax=Methylobacterium oryzihabitans TaxID=2499852 RepID=A0A3S2YLH8_9HYPH|nr:helix-turn-helix domain-containing protein [Methylobacterium oryzihabitans]RVU13850.1 helix-turn-helix domain-containing protein [Methylobacterium oryzihabitans]